MNNCTTNTYEMKREIVNFAKNISNGVNKSTSKFVMDMQYSIATNLQNKNYLVQYVGSCRTL